MQVRWNKFGRFLGCSAYPDCQSTRPIDATEVQERSLGEDPETGLPVLARVGPYGPYVQLGNGDGKEKPRRVSIPKGMTLEDMGLNYGLLLLSLPRPLGLDPETGKEVTVGIGRYGPYVHSAGNYRNLNSPVLLFEIELDEALKLLATQTGSGGSERSRPAPGNRHRVEGSRWPLRALCHGREAECQLAEDPGPERPGNGRCGGPSHPSRVQEGQGKGAGKGGARPKAKATPKSGRGKAAKGKAAKGKVGKGKASKGTAAKGKESS